MPAKHRCSCFSEESSSFLYGLRREAPSTERVLLERLLNVLSRAAANKKSNNPQRLWAESERPEWWPGVTLLCWKNPREHPKDNKKTLKEKIAILETQLKQRELMSKELEEELEAQKNGKKVDLELKSDFEAVIAKASGLHFMLNKVKTKMGDSKPMSDRISKYVTETQACMEKCLQVIEGFHKKVEAREQHRQNLWDRMGVSKAERGQPSAKRPHSDVSYDLETDSLSIDLDDADDVEALHMALASPSFSASPFSPAATLSPSPQNMSDIAVADMLMGVPSPTFIPQSQYVHAVTSYQRSLSMPSPVQAVPEPLLSMDQLQLRSVSPIPVPGCKPSSKKSMRRSDEARGKSLQQRSPMDSLVEALGSEDIESIEISQSTLPPTSGSKGKRVAESDVQRRKDRKQRQSPLNRPKSSGIKEKSSTPPTVEVKSSRKSATFPMSYRYSGGQLMQAGAPSNPEAGWQVLHTIPASDPSWPLRIKNDASSPLASEDLVEDGDGRGVRMDVSRSSQDDDLDNVAEVLEESESRPTFSMYTVTDMGDMDNLAQMTTHLSCDDLQASVTEPVMDSAPPSSVRLVLGPERVMVPGQYVFHSAPLSSSSAARSATTKGDSKSLSHAIGNLKDTFK